MLYSEALRAKPKPKSTLTSTSTFSVLPPRRKTNGPPPKSRRVCVEDESDTEDTAAKSLVAVQRLSETTREISPAWDAPTDAHHTKTTQLTETPRPASFDRNANPTPTTKPENRNTTRRAHKSSRHNADRVLSTQRPSQPVRPIRMCADKQCGTRSWASPIRCHCHDFAALYADTPGYTIETEKGTCFVKIPDHYRTKHSKQSKPRIKKKKVTFLSLPGEIRNQIYAEVLPECRVLILRSHPNKELALIKSDWSRADQQHKRPRAQLYHKLDNGQIDEGLELTTNLLLSCKEVKQDVERYFYSRTTFCFDSMKVVNSFIKRVSLQGLQAIQKLEISHDGYGNPELMENAIYRDRYYNQWCKTCASVGRKLTGLKHLKINAHLQQWPCDMSQLGINSAWRHPFLQLAPRRLTKVEIVLQHSMFDHNTRLMRDIAHKLEDDMMTDEGRQERDLAESKLVLTRMEAKKAAKEAKRQAQEMKERAPTELTITMDQIKQQKNAPVKFCNTGLEKYTKLDMTYMAPFELNQFKAQYCSGKNKP